MELKASIFCLLSQYSDLIRAGKAERVSFGSSENCIADMTTCIAHKVLPKGIALPDNLYAAVEKLTQAGCAGRECILLDVDFFNVLSEELLADCPELCIPQPLPVCSCLRLRQEHPALLYCAEEVLLDDLVVEAQRDAGGWRSEPFYFEWPSSVSANGLYKKVLYLDGFAPLERADGGGATWERLDRFTARVSWEKLSEIPRDLISEGKIFLGLLFPVPQIAMAANGETTQVWTSAPISAATGHLLFKLGEHRFECEWTISSEGARTTIPMGIAKSPVSTSLFLNALPGTPFSVWRRPQFSSLWREDCDGVLWDARSGEAIYGRQQFPEIYRLSGEMLYLPEHWTVETIRNIAEGQFIPFDLPDSLATSAVAG